MVRSVLSLLAASIVVCSAASAQTTLTGKTWTGGSCMVDILFGADGRFGEFNDHGENHYGQWEMDGNILYLVYEDMSYQQAEFEGDVFEVSYYDSAGETLSCTFS